jgi:hypothetical protein
MIKPTRHQGRPQQHHVTEVLLVIKNRYERGSEKDEEDTDAHEGDETLPAEIN